MQAKHYYFSLIHFQIDDLDIHLALPQIWQADCLYQAIAHDRDQIGRWLPWAYDMHSAADEAKFITSVQQQILKKRILALTILVNDQPCGMIDLHQIIPEQKGEIGYWLSRQYQKRGIITHCVKELCQYAFSELKLKYIDLIVATDNLPSTHVAQRAGFKLMGLQKDLIRSGVDGQIFRKIA